MMAKKLPKKIKASKELQARIGTGAIDESRVSAAQKVMDENKVEFAPLARPELDKLQQALDRARKDESDPAAVLNSLKEPIMNLKANAGAFNYGFVSELTGKVLLFLETIQKPNRKVIQIVDILHKTILLALAYQMKGDGGEQGKVLLQTFDQVLRKYKPPKS